MSHPDLVSSHLGDENIVATVNLSGEDLIVITPSRSLLYQSEGILSDESVTEYPHNVSAIAVSEGRRKSTIELDYPIADAKSIRIPNPRLDTVLHYLLAGVFHAQNITEPGETIQSVYRFNELTVVITSQRVLTHVGSVVWDEEYDAYRYDDLTGLEFEAGNIATEIVLYVDGRSQRIKVPKSRSEEVKQALEAAVLSYYDVETLAEFADVVETEVEQPETDTTIAFDEAVPPLAATPANEDAADTAAMDEPWPYESAEVDMDAITDTLEELQKQIERQRAILEEQESALASLVRELQED